MRSTRQMLTEWDPEQEETWNKRLAWTTLTITTYSMILTFIVWFLVSALAPKLNSIGFNLTTSELYWLASMPGLSCGFLRLVYMFLPPLVGTRKLVGGTSLLCILPMIGWFVAVQNPETPFWVLLGLAAATGIGGAAFSGYMPSTGYFFPKRLQGTALGIQGGVGNLGVSVVQLVAPILMSTSIVGLTWIAPQNTPHGPLYVHNAAIFFAPWLIIASILAFTMLRDVPVKANIRQQIDIFSNPNTWIMTLMYVMTFGLFSGFSAQFALLINQLYGPTSQFASLGTTVQGATYAFLGPLIGSLVRSTWGPFCDRFGGGMWTFLSALGIGVSLLAAIPFLTPTSPSQFRWFLAAMLVMFFFTGIGNASTFKQMPMIMPKRQAGGAIGFTAAIASFGPFFVGVGLTTFGPVAWFSACVGLCIICAVVSWLYYARPGAPFPG